MRTLLTVSILLNGFLMKTEGETPSQLPSPEEQYKSLRAELDRAVQAWEGAKTVEERRRIGWPSDLFGKRFLDLAKRCPKEPLAFDCLQRIVSWEIPEATEAIEILAREYTRRPEIRLICPDLEGYSDLQKAEDLLRQVVASNPERRTQGTACLSLARYLKLKSRFVRYLKADPDADETSREIEKGFGADYLNRLKRLDPDRLLGESDDLFEQVVAKYDDVKVEGKSLSVLATAELFERRVLTIGKEAPAIEGQDLEGKPLRLRDYRGQVVVLDFWSHELCGACRQMYPHQRELVKRLTGKPFLMLGINNDSDRAKARAAMVREGLTWKAWWDPGEPFGPISERWNVQSWPTVYVIDHKGIIRFKNVHGHDLDEAVDQLLQERESDVSQKF